mmetsp:Transcript_19009/g.27751  ORF Transcript_19009/g.27751 Transcript_19009/m.27751 type:complete len:168 (-) Transcript_19009:48-551(-)
MDLLSCPTRGTTAKASSVLNKNAKLYGAMNALDIKNESSCWNSEGTADGQIQHSYIINFHRRVKISSISLQFQGGFASEECQLFTTLVPLPSSKSTTTNGHVLNWREIEDAYIEPENINTAQEFDMAEVERGDDLVCDAIKLMFQAHSDFYGRVILYKIKVHGEESH